MSKLTKNLVYLGGIPTDMDVDLLDKAFKPKEGDIISYEEISAVIKLKKTDNRWNTIVNRWRKKLGREKNLILSSIRGEGYECLNSSKRVGYASGKYKSGLKLVVKAANVAAATNRAGLNEEELRVCDHVQNTGAQLKLAAAVAARQLKYPNLERNGKLIDKPS